MDLELKTIEIIAEALESLRQEGKSDYRFRTDLSEEYTASKKKGLPNKEYGLAIDRIQDVIDAARTKNPKHAKRVHGEFIENLAFVTNRSLDSFFKHEKTIQYIPSFIRNFSKGIKSKITSDSINSNKSILIENNELELFILRLNPTRIDYGEDYVIHSIEDIDEDYLQRIFLKSHEPNDNFMKAFILEKKNRFERYAHRLKKESKGKVKITQNFLNDKDMNGPFNLFILVSKRKNRVIYTARTFSHIKDVLDEVDGEKLPITGDYDKMMSKKKDDFLGKIEHSGSGQYFVVDRLSGRVPYEFGLMYIYGKMILYKAFLRFHNIKKESNIICLARREPTNSLLFEYISFGLKIEGVNFYNIGDFAISHWVLQGQISKLINDTESSIFLKKFIISGIK